MEYGLKTTVGKNLKESRTAAGYTQAQVAKLMNMTQQQYSRFENGIFELNYDQLVYLCTLFDVSSDFLLGLSLF